MNKLLLSLMLVNFITISCQTQQHIVTYDKKEYILTEEEKEYDITGYSLNIFFEEYFAKNNVAIFVDGEKVFDDNLTTKKVLGLAGYFQLKNFPKSLTIIIDNDEVKINPADIQGYKYLYINVTKTREKRFNFSNKPVTYQ